MTDDWSFREAVDALKAQMSIGSTSCVLDAVQSAGIRGRVDEALSTARRELSEELKEKIRALSKAGK